MIRLLFVLLIVKAIILGWVVSQGTIGLAPDEAQYWTWSQQLDWGYYSKPPAIAWQIALTTFLFGNNPFGVRFGALILGLLISLSVYAVARAAELSVKTAFWAACVAAFTPLGVYLSFVATTDGGMVLFFTLATALLLKGIKHEKAPPYLLIGLAILAGALYKWTAYFFWPLALVSLLFFKKMRSWKILAGMLISLLALLPSLYWNVQHEWATFRHVVKTVGTAKQGNFFDYLASQIGLLFPIFFGLLICSCCYLRKEKKTALWFLAIFPAALLLYISAGLFKKMQPNWAIYLYPATIPLIAWVACERLKHGKIWLTLGSALSVGCITFLFALPHLQEKGQLPLSYHLSPFRQQVGGNRISPSLIAAGYRPEEDFLFSDKYQATSLLSFYNSEQKRAYYFNVSETRKNQFSYWPQMNLNEIGKTGYFVVMENVTKKALDWYEKHYQERLQPYFEQIEYRGAYPLFSVAGKPVKYALIFACKDYSGKLPLENNKF